jgi:MFS family permease
VAMILGTFAYGPLDRLFGTRKWVIFGGNVVVVLACAMVAAQPALGYGAAVALCAVIGMFGLTFPVIMAHGRSFIPAHLTGRGVTLMNLFSIGGVGLMQVFTGRLHAASAGASVDVAYPYQMLFGFFAVVLGAGMVVYLFAQDRLD